MKKILPFLFLLVLVVVPRPVSAVFEVFREEGGSGKSDAHGAFGPGRNTTDYSEQARLNAAKEAANRESSQRTTFRDIQSDEDAGESKVVSDDSPDDAAANSHPNKKKSAFGDDDSSLDQLDLDSETLLRKTEDAIEHAKKIEQRLSDMQRQSLSGLILESSELRIFQEEALEAYERWKGEEDRYSEYLNSLNEDDLVPENESKRRETVFALPFTPEEIEEGRKLQQITDYIAASHEASRQALRFRNYLKTLVSRETVWDDYALPTPVTPTRERFLSRSSSHDTGETTPGSSVKSDRSFDLPYKEALQEENPSTPPLSRAVFHDSGGISEASPRTSLGTPGTSPSDHETSLIAARAFHETIQKESSGDSFRDSAGDSHQIIEQLPQKTPHEEAIENLQTTIATLKEELKSSQKRKDEIRQRILAIRNQGLTLYTAQGLDLQMLRDLHSQSEHEAGVLGRLEKNLIKANDELGDLLAPDGGVARRAAREEAAEYKRQEREKERAAEKAEREIREQKIAKWEADKLAAAKKSQGSSSYSYRSYGGGSSTSSYNWGQQQVEQQRQQQEQAQRQQASAAAWNSQVNSWQSMIQTQQNFVQMAKRW